jgi:ketosteroid isomerase-like protein
MVSGPDWPERVSWHGRDGIRANMREWQGVWESSEIEVGGLEEFGDKLVGGGTWVTRGKTSGVPSRMPFVILFTLRDGKIAVVEWFTDHDAAVAAARDA